MRNRIQIALVLAGLLLLSGCGLGGVYEMKGESFLSLDRAMALATTTDDLWNLWEKAPLDDKTKIEEVLLNASSKMNAQDRTETLQTLQSRASSEKIRDTATGALREYEQAEKEGERRREEERAQAEKEAQKKAEELHLAHKEAMQRLVQEAGGRLDDKSAQEVNRLVDRWRAIGVLYYLDQDVSDTPLVLDKYRELMRNLSDTLKQLQTMNNFHKAFGQPQRTQLISGLYYLYYDCRDGTVQMEIEADSLDRENHVRVRGLNIL